MRTEFRISHQAVVTAFFLTVLLVPLLAATIIGKPTVIRVDYIPSSVSSKNAVAKALIGRIAGNPKIISHADSTDFLYNAEKDRFEYLTAKPVSITPPPAHERETFPFPCLQQSFYPSRCPIGWKQKTLS